MQGTIVDVHTVRGHGFILGEDGKSYFFHETACKNCRIEDLEEGREVTFEESEGSQGLRAEDVYV